MLKKNHTLPLLFLILTAVAAPAFAFSNPPAWLKQAATTQTPAYDKEVPAVVLLNDTMVSYNNGTLVTTRNYAIKVLTREGRDEAVARAFYLTSGGSVRDISAWIIRADGTSKDYDKKSVIDLIQDPNDIYNEYRFKLIDASGDMDIGMVFGYTTVTEERPLIFQERWFTQLQLPVILSRYTVSVPEGWKASSVTFNRPSLAPTVNGNTYTWELRDLPYIKDEPMSPTFTNIAPWIAINYGPAGQVPPDKVFADWNAAAKWMSTLYDPQVVVDDVVAAKAQELTANAKTELEKIRAVAAFAQNIQYISFDIGVASGNGYRPRASNLVLSRGYGDCKDKANLMRAMLRALKIDSFPVLIYSGDPTFVREEWASPSQFNHCIIAIRVGDGTDAPTVIKHPELGRLLIFDPTDAYTTVGDLPDYLQGSFAMIIAGDKGGLARMPVTPSESNLLDRSVEASISPDGAVLGTIKERSIGQASSTERQFLRRLSATDYNKMLERWLTAGATGARLLKYTPNDRVENSGFDLDVEFSAPGYGQLMQGRLLVFKPAIVNRRNALWLTDPKRTHPVIIDSEAVRETAVFTLPQGFTVDETPDAVKLETPFGSYVNSYEVTGNKLRYTRKLTLNRATVPPDKYNGVREFFAKVREAEQSPVVLVRK